MKKDDMVYIGHMLDFALSISEKVTGKDRDYYDNDEILRLALTHLVQSIGEAARLVNEETRLKYPSIPWSEIVGMRHLIVHDYINVDYDVVWSVVTQDIPQLIDKLKKIAP